MLSLKKKPNKLFQWFSQVISHIIYQMNYHLRAIRMSQKVCPGTKIDVEQYYTKFNKTYKSILQKTFLVHSDTLWRCLMTAVVENLSKMLRQRYPDSSQNAEIAYLSMKLLSLWSLLDWLSFMKGIKQNCSDGSVLISYREVTRDS